MNKRSKQSVTIYADILFQIVISCVAEVQNTLEDCFGKYDEQCT